MAGYVLKDAYADELPMLLRTVMRGETYLSPAISRKLVDTLRTRLGRGGAAPAATDPLTPRQRVILQLVAEGASRPRRSRTCSA